MRITILLLFISSLAFGQNEQILRIGKPNSTENLLCKELVEFPTQYIEENNSEHFPEISYLRPIIEVVAYNALVTEGGCTEEYIDSTGKVCIRPLPIEYAPIGKIAKIVGYEKVVLYEGQMIEWRTRRVDYCGFVDEITSPCKD
jgi:hypothetical protein